MHSDYSLTCESDAHTPNTCWPTMFKTYLDYAESAATEIVSEQCITTILRLSARFGQSCSTLPDDVE